MASYESTLDVRDNRRRLSEETLLGGSDCEGSSGRDRDGRDSSRASERASVFELDYLSGGSSPSSPHKFGRLARIRHIFSQVAIFLLPSFISPYFTGVPPAPERLAPTAWLDGLRGLACVSVVIHHYFSEYSKELENPYNGYEDTKLMQFPIIKLIQYGAPMVKIFFIISGFVLSVKAVRLTRTTGTLDTAQLIGNLSTSIWKRYLRLFIPCVAGYLVCVVMIQIGMFEVIPIGEKPKWLTGNREDRPPTHDNIFAQLAWAFDDYWILGVEHAIWNNKSRHYRTDGHLWTIPTEFRNSLALFLLIAGVSTLKRWIRVYIVLPALFSCLLYQGGWAWGLALFIYGYFLAELHSDIVAAGPSTLPSSEKTAPPTSRIKRVAWYLLLVVGLYFISYPRHKQQPLPHANGFQWLLPLTPAGFVRASEENKWKDGTHEFWESIGSMIIVFALMHIPRIQRDFLNSRIIQYYGKISFALYVMHGHIHHSIGYWGVVNGLKFVGIWAKNSKGKWDINPDANVGVWNAVIIFSFMFVTFPCTTWAADVLWRGADMQSVRFLRWLESKIRK